MGLIEYYKSAIMLPVWLLGGIFIALFIYYFCLGGYEAEEAKRKAEYDRVMAKIAEEEQACNELVAQVEAEYGFTAGNVFCFAPKSRGAMIVDANAEHLVIVDKWEEHAVTRHWHKSELVSFEVLHDIRQQTSTFGTVIPVNGVPLLAANTNYREEFKGSYIKILVKDVQDPWVIVPVWSMVDAMKWEGILGLMVPKVA